MKEISQPKKEVKHNIKHDILRQKKLDKREEELSLKLSNRQKKNRHQDIKVKLLLNSPLAPQFSKKKKGFSWQI